MHEQEKKIKALLCDDETDFRQLMSFWMQSKGYTVVEASNGQEAVEIARKENPDIIFLDLNMPVMDGTEALMKIREFNKTVPVIIISAYVEDKRAKEAMSAGIAGVFYKGKDFQEGLALLEAALHTHRQLKK
ncbi:MAG: response regulator [Candidatus Omnitrophica bacterium]|nr:response regulator [Candidatus Omnitrophota bacterium]MDD4941363.1 response regulator [Candidatus Omnitrophota bacterium]MDD5774523.1 response regulator [Candidatus Omnitrophota bacterium]HNQ50606.1 response regulator [Candidatus Omnitrophota bacterium]HQO38212.1 response regulator [Candidatus Omnitrophota bacterium]